MPCYLWQHVEFSSARIENANLTIHFQNTPVYISCILVNNCDVLDIVSCEGGDEDQNRSDT